MATAEQDVSITNLDVSLVDPSPFQHRKHFPESKLRELANSITRDGLVEPIVVRKTGKRFQLIAGERRLRAVRDHSDLRSILSRIVSADDKQARRMCAAENLQRQDLSDIESAEAIVEIIDAELCDDSEYASLGESPKDRVAKLLRKCWNVYNSQEQGKSVRKASQDWCNRFITLLETLFAALPKPTEWHSFFMNDLPLVTKVSAEVRDIAIANKLNKSQTKALDSLAKSAPDVFERIISSRTDEGSVAVPVDLAKGDDGEQLSLAEISANDIRKIREYEEFSRSTGDKPIREERNTPRLPDGKYNVIYADPPWRYDFSVSDSREIENHYPTMEIEDICALPISDLAADDCVLFVWGTSPKLRECFAVIDAWGFEYKTCMVWVKDKIGMGYYARQRHELLLIATKGNPPVPEPSSRPDSVVNGERTVHSRKPALFYGLIEKMYPDSQKVELFCRTPQQGWSVWGNEA